MERSGRIWRLSVSSFSGRREQKDYDEKSHFGGKFPIKFEPLKGSRPNYVLRCNDERFWSIVRHFSIKNHEAESDHAECLDF